MVAGCRVTRPVEESVRADRIVDANVLYDANCAGCHGVDGRHGVAQPLNDPVYLALVGAPRLRDVIANGVRGTAMTAFAVDAGGMLTNEQVRALADGIAHRWGNAQAASAPLPAYTADEAIARGGSPGDPARGRTAFQMFCARCHGADGRGGTAGSVVDDAFLSLTSDQALRTTVIAGRPDENIPGWREYVPGRAMTEQEISDVVAWLASHRGTYE